MTIPDKMQCDKQITFGNVSYLCLLNLGHEGPCQRPALDGLVGRDVTDHDLPSVETTRQAIIDALVKAGVIGARQSVDRLIAAVEAKRDATLIQPMQPSDVDADLGTPAPDVGMLCLGSWRTPSSGSGS